jgi:hypothetical protein
MTENTQSIKNNEGQVQFIIPWAEKRKEFGNIIANEEMIAQHWDMNENLLFFFLMWLGTY